MAGDSAKSMTCLGPSDRCRIALLCLFLGALGACAQLPPRPDLPEQIESQGRDPAGFGHDTHGVENRDGVYFVQCLKKGRDGEVLSAA
jgi:hypothetical protein